MKAATQARIDDSPLAWLDAVQRQRHEAGLRRCLRPRPAVATELDLASNDYLGLSRHPAVIDGGVQALRIWGAGATGSRLVTGDTKLHQQFEAELAEFVGAAAGLLFSSGYTANLGAVSACPARVPCWCPTPVRMRRWWMPVGCRGRGLW